MVVTHMKNKALVAAVSLAAVLGAALTGCSAPEEPAETGPTGDTTFDGNFMALRFSDGTPDEIKSLDGERCVENADGSVDIFGTAGDETPLSLTNENGNVNIKATFDSGLTYTFVGEGQQNVTKNFQIDMVRSTITDKDGNVVDAEGILSAQAACDLQRTLETTP